LKSLKTLQMVRTALFSGILCVLAPVALPVPGSPVPVSLATFVVYLAGMVLGAKQGVICVLVYLLLGTVGLPVFSGFSGGAGVLLGPTGGYLLGYIPCVLVVGLSVEKRELICKKLKEELTSERVGRARKMMCYGLAMVMGTLLCYAIGTVWFIAVMEGSYTFLQALLVCVVPYLLFDAVKIAAAATVGLPLCRIIKKRETSVNPEDFR